MNGIEKITGRIEADAQEQAKAIAAEAEARCAEIRADYDKQAQNALDGIDRNMQYLQQQVSTIVSGSYQSNYHWGDR